MTDSWNPAQYERFKTERAQPFYDLMGLLELPRASDNRERVIRAVDLGCGTGELTAALHRRLGGKGLAVSTLGLDSSAAMLERSSEFAEPGLHFEQGNIAEFAQRYANGHAPERSNDESSGGVPPPTVQPPIAPPYDLIFSNAALQWLDDHAQLFPRLLAAVAPGGQFAVQMPANGDHPAYRLAAEVAAEPRFAALLGGHQRQSPVLPPEDYALLLARAGMSEQHVELRVYLHQLPDRAGLLEWIKGSLLTDYEKRLSAEDYSAYLARYSELLAERLPDESPFLFTFKRLLLWGKKG